MARTEHQQEALSRAIGGFSMSNYPAVFHGFMSKGIPEEEIRPRENVFTFQAWKALGRVVRKGEHGVKICTFIVCSKEDKENPDKKKTFPRPWFTTVFHISQTEPL